MLIYRWLFQSSFFKGYILRWMRLWTKKWHASNLLLFPDGDLPLLQPAEQLWDLQLESALWGWLGGSGGCRGDLHLQLRYLGLRPIRVREKGKNKQKYKDSIPTYKRQWLLLHSKHFFFAYKSFQHIITSKLFQTST